ncbi:MAG: type II toxin-antitoxin system HicA family toxin [Thermodesulfobacteriota bacterium]
MERLGFYEVRQRGSYRQFRHADGQGTTVPWEIFRGCFLRSITLNRSSVFFSQSSTNCFLQRD